MRKIFVLVSVLLSMSGLLHAQTAGISGTVTDSSGAVMSRGEVKLQDLKSGMSRQVTTDEAGRYRFDALSGASYELTFTREGFETARKTLLLSTGSTVLDVTLGVSGISTNILVKEAGGTVADI